jgi:hypothetical protein
VIAFFRQVVVRNLVSPYGLAAFSYCIFLVAWLFPPTLYTSLINEPDLIFLNLPTLVFFTLCAVAFLIGVRSVHLLAYAGYRPPPDDVPPVAARAPILYLAAPLLIASALCAVYLAKLGAHIDFVGLLASGQGQMVKAAMGGVTEGNWAAALNLLSAVLWWAAFRGMQLRPRGFARIVLLLSFSIALVTDLVTCVATVDRTNLMPVVSGLFLIYLFFKVRDEQVSLPRLALTGFGAALASIGAFLALAFLRGASAGRLLAASLMGYTIVSYNRLAALVTGVMHYAYQGRAVYLLPLLVRNDRINTLIPMRDWFGWPDLLVQMESEFSAVLAAGLNGNYNWAGYFGYIYSDLGWWAPLYCLLVGVFCGLCWRRFCAGTSDGIVMYMWNAFGILFWVGGNWLLGERIVRTGVAAFLLFLYDRYSLRSDEDSVSAAPLKTAPLRERVL